VAHQQTDLEAFIRGNARYRLKRLAMVPNRELTNAITCHIYHVQLVRLAKMEDLQVRGTTLQRLHGLYDAFLSSDAELVHVRILRHPQQQ